jgi:hypothetical protein
MKDDGTSFIIASSKSPYVLILDSKKRVLTVGENGEIKFLSVDDAKERHLALEDSMWGIRCSKEQNMTGALLLYCANKPQKYLRVTAVQEKVEASEVKPPKKKKIKC